LAAGNSASFRVSSSIFAASAAISICAESLLRAAAS